MKILLTLGLGENIVYSMIAPLAQIEEIEEITIARNINGPILPKVTYYTIPNWILKFPLLRAAYKFFLLLHLSKVKKPDMIMAYYLVSYGINALLISKIINRPISISIVSNKELEVYGKIPKIILSKLIMYPDIITVTGSKTKRDLENLGVPSRKIWILPHGVDTSIFYPRHLTKKYDVITVARLENVKNIPTLLKAVKNVKKIFPKIKVGIVGKGPYKDRLRETAINLKVDDNVEFLGFIPKIQLFYNTGKIFILTSKWEGLPYSMLEAMASGIPPIVSDVGDISDVIIKEFNGLVINDCNDDKAFAQAIMRLLNNENLYKKISTNALKTIKEHHRFEVVKKTWSQIFKQKDLI